MRTDHPRDRFELPIYSSPRRPDPWGRAPSCEFDRVNGSIMTPFASGADRHCDQRPPIFTAHQYQSSLRLARRVLVRRDLLRPRQSQERCPVWRAPFWRTRPNAINRCGAQGGSSLPVGVFPIPIAAGDVGSTATGQQMLWFFNFPAEAECACYPWPVMSSMNSSPRGHIKGEDVELHAAAHRWQQYGAGGGLHAWDLISAFD